VQEENSRNDHTVQMRGSGITVSGNVKLTPLGN